MLSMGVTVVEIHYCTILYKYGVATNMMSYLGFNLIARLNQRRAFSALSLFQNSLKKHKKTINDKKKCEITTIFVCNLLLCIFSLLCRGKHNVRVVLTSRKCINGFCILMEFK